MDSTCYNHMTPHSSLFSEFKPAPHPFNIHTVNGSTMSGHNIGSVSISNLLVLEVFNVPDLSYNLFSMEQLAELGYRIIFDYSGCIVQDPRTGPELRTGPRGGENLNIIGGSTRPHALPKVSMRLNHAPHASLGHLQHALYGLKQASRVWFSKFSSTISHLGYMDSHYFSCMWMI